VDRTINRKVSGIFLSPDGAKSETIDEFKQTASSLTKGEISRVARMGKTLEKHFGSPRTSEVAIEGDDVYLLQSRPITKPGRWLRYTVDPGLRGTSTGPT
jgi:pyruvate,water dikinase